MNQDDPIETRFSGKGLVLCIDVVTVAASFFLAYLIRFNFSLNFDVSGFMIQLPVVVLITFSALLLTGSYKGEVRYSGIREVSTNFKVIGLSSILVFLLVVINHKWGIYSEFSIPLSVLIIFSLLSSAGLTASRYVYMAIYKALVK